MPTNPTNQDSRQQARQAVPVSVLEEVPPAGADEQEEKASRYDPQRPKSIWVIERQLGNILAYYEGKAAEAKARGEKAQGPIKYRLKPGARAGSTRPEDYLPYISWQTARDFVSEVTRGLWESGEALVTWGDHGRVTVAVPVTVIAAEGRITRTGLGGDREPQEQTASDGERRTIEWKWNDYNSKWERRGEGFDPVLDAWAQGFKRALAEFGLARELYPE